MDSHLHFYSVRTEVLYHIDLRGQHANLPSPCQAKQGNNPTAHKPSMTLNTRCLDANLPHTATVPGINLPVEEVHSGTHAVSSAKISPQCPWHIEAAAHTGRAGGCTSTQDAGSQAKAANSRKADSVRFMCYKGGGLIHIRAQKYASHHVDADFRELHISAGITHHPNLNPEGDAGFCWSLPETSKLNETSRTPVFSARTAAILMRH